MLIRSLHGAELDMWVAKALGWDEFRPVGILNGVCYARNNEWVDPRRWYFSTSWADAGPLIEDHRISLELNPGYCIARCFHKPSGIRCYSLEDKHDRVLVAAMRVLVASIYDSWYVGNWHE